MKRHPMGGCNGPRGGACAHELPVYVDPVLVALADCLVLTALERAWSRTVPRSQRAAVRTGERHRGYTVVPIHVDRIDKALEGAWVTVPLLVARHDLDVDPTEWATLLDSYARSLIMMQQPHHLTLLREFLAPLGDAAARATDWVAV